LAVQAASAGKRVIQLFHADGRDDIPANEKVSRHFAMPSKRYNPCILSSSINTCISVATLALTSMYDGLVVQIACAKALASLMVMAVS
jgi:hypothetical protein